MNAAPGSSLVAYSSKRGQPFLLHANDLHASHKIARIARESQIATPSPIAPPCHPDIRYLPLANSLRMLAVTFAGSSGCPVLLRKLAPSMGLSHRTSHPRSRSRRPAVPSTQPESNSPHPPTRPRSPLASSSAHPVRSRRRTRRSAGVDASGRQPCVSSLFRRQLSRSLKPECLRVCPTQRSRSQTHAPADSKRSGHQRRLRLQRALAGRYKSTRAAAQYQATLRRGRAPGPLLSTRVFRSSSDRSQHHLKTPNNISLIIRTVQTACTRNRRPAFSLDAIRRMLKTQSPLA